MRILSEDEIDVIAEQKAGENVLEAICKAQQAVTAWEMYDKVARFANPKYASPEEVGQVNLMLLQLQLDLAKEGITRPEEEQK